VGLSLEVKSQDIYAPFPPLVNYETQPTAWNLFKSEYPSIMEKMGPSEAVMLAQVSGLFCDAKLRDDSQKFFAVQNLPGARRILENGKDWVNSCIQVRDLQQKNLASYLEK
jgi:hypothetical protein